MSFEELPPQEQERIIQESIKAWREQGLIMTREEVIRMLKGETITGAELRAIEERSMRIEPEVLPPWKPNIPVTPTPTYETPTEGLIQESLQSWAEQGIFLTAEEAKRLIEGETITRPELETIEQRSKAIIQGATVSEETAEWLTTTLEGTRAMTEVVAGHKPEQLTEEETEKVKKLIETAKTVPYAPIAAAGLGLLLLLWFLVRRRR